MLSKIAIRKQLNRFRTWRWRDSILLALLILLVACGNTIWINLETRPPHWDMARHLWTSLNYLEIARGWHLKGLLQAYYYYPPMVYLLVLPWYAMLGPTIQTAVTANLTFVIILVLSTYGLARKLGNRLTGLVAAAATIASPMFASQFKEFQIDAPLSAIVTLALYLIVTNGEFSRLGLSVALGLVLGIGLLTKWTFLFIIALPLALNLGRGLWLAYQDRAAKRLVNIGLTLLITYAVSSFWYITNQTQLKLDLFNNGVTAGAREGDPAVGSALSNIWYLINLFSRQLYLVPALLVIAGLIFTLRRRHQFNRNFYPLLLVIGTLAFFTLLRNKDARYTLPMVPAAIIIGSSWLAQLRPRLQRILGFGFIAYAALSFYAISFGLPVLPAEIGFVINQQPMTIFAQHGYIIGAPTHEDWVMELAFQDASRGPTTQQSLACECDDTIWFNSWALFYYSRRYKVGIVSPSEAGFILVRQLPIEASHGNDIRLWQQTLPDKTTATLYRRAGTE